MICWREFKIKYEDNNFERMPYKEHKDLKSPNDENTRISRYVTFPKFLNMLDQSALYFTSADKFTDQYEGKYPIANFNKLHNLTELEKSIAHHNMKWTEDFVRKWLRINCWNMTQYELPALWEQYVKKNGVTIQSTFKKLANSFDKTTYNVNIGIVNYIDRQVEEIPENNVFYLYVNKMRNYEYEKELRAFVTIPTPEKAGSIDLSQFPSGWNVPINLDVLIEKIVLYPNASQWIIDVVKSILEKYNLDKEVTSSELNERAVE
jgi:hypothetical protein